MSGSTFKMFYADETIAAAHATPQPTKDSIYFNTRKNALLMFFDIDVLDFCTCKTLSLQREFVNYL